MISIIALTPMGKNLAEKLLVLCQGQGLTCQLWYKPKPFAEQIQQAFQQGHKLIFICATGIVFRTLAPVLQDKYQDPPVLVLDEQGKYVIPLLSGHEGGANDLAAQVSHMLGAELVMTTAKAYVNPIYTLGMGCERNCDLGYLEELMLEALAQKGLTPQDIESLTSIDLKADETNLIRLAEKYHWPFVTYSVPELSTMEALLSTRSDYIYKTVGVYGVAESAALYGASQISQQPAELVLNKIKNAKATCAIARAYLPTQEANSDVEC